MLKVIDKFAGLGGWSAAAKLAGMSPVWAANHNPIAVQYHKLNHPDSDVVCQDLHQVDWGIVPPHDGVLASPCCQGHSKARGTDAPHHDASRATAWAVVSCLEYHRSGFAVVENVPEYLDWELYPSWCDALQRLGYAVSPHVLDAADSGIPQHRERVFIVLTKSKAPLKLKLERKAHVAVADYIDWGDIYDWSPVDKPGRSAATLARVASGRTRFGERFVAPFYSSGSGLTGRSIHRPIGTLTTKDRWSVIKGDRMRVLQPDESRAIMSFPVGTILPRVKHQATHLLGNAVAPMQGADVLRALQAQL